MMLGILHFATAVIFGVFSLLWDRSNWKEICVIAALVALIVAHTIAAGIAFWRLMA